MVIIKKLYTTRGTQRAQVESDDEKKKEEKLYWIILLKTVIIQHRCIIHEELKNANFIESERF